MTQELGYYTVIFKSNQQEISSYVSWQLKYMYIQILEHVAPSGSAASFVIILSWTLIQVRKKEEPQSYWRGCGLELFNVQV